MRTFLLTLAFVVVAVAAWCGLPSTPSPDVAANAPVVVADVARETNTVASLELSTEAERTVPGREPERMPAPPVALRSSAWSVTVVDPDGVPVEGATVRVEGRREEIASTDRDGIARFAAVPGWRTSVSVRAGNRHAVCQGDLARVTLPWCGPLHGRLVDRATGAPIAGAKVVGEGVVTDPNGAFVLPAVARGEGRLFEFEAPEYPRQEVPLRLPGRGEPVAHTFAITRAAVIAGRCVDVESRRGLAEAEVECQNRRVSTDADGAFRLLVVPAHAIAEARLTFAAPGYARATYEVPLSPSPGAREFALLRASELSGRVVSAAGDPIPFARVKAQPRDRAARMPADMAQLVDEERDYPRAFADEHGAFVVSGLVPGRAYELEAQERGFKARPDQEPVVRAGDRTDPIVLVLTPIAAIPTGTIVGTFRCNGVPVRGRIDWRVGRAAGQVATKADGSFRCKGVPAGAVELTAKREAEEGSTLLIGGSAAEWRRKLELRANEELRVDVDLRLDLVPITGRVRNADGSPAGCQLVDVVGADCWESVMTTPDGSFQVDVLRSAGAVTLGVAHRARVAVHPGARDVEIVLPPWGIVRYRVRGEDGSSGSIEQVWLLPERWSSCCTGTRVHAPDPDGFFELHVAQGERLFLCSAPGHASTLRSVQVGAHATVDVVLGRGTSVRMRLRAGAPGPDSRSEVLLVDGRLVDFRASDYFGYDGVAHWVRLRAEGEEVQHVDPGTYRLVAVDPAIEITPATIAVGSAPVVVDVTWTRRAK
ncbi:MAG TPA: hypothetical protein VFD82_04845 [Planctomycetota bacterium]|nr:hypothetical protein [Planctomycetota bacterium]